MLRIRSGIVAATVLAASLLSFGAASAADAPTLYKRLGGYDAIAAVTDTFIGKLVGDPQLSKFFGGHATSSLQRIRQLAVDQLCAATGGPCVYIGRDMKSAHAGLGVTEADWNRPVDHLKATLAEFKVGAAEQAELLAVAGTLKRDIVEKP